MTTTTMTTAQAKTTLAPMGDFDKWRQAAQSWALNLSSDRTRRAYLAAWGDFLAFVGKSPDLVNQDDVIAFKTYLKTTPTKTGKPSSQSTINQRLSALSSFFTFAQGRGLRADNPADGVKREAVSPYGKATWLKPKKGEDLAFLGAIDDSTDQGKRDKAIALLFLTQALRVAELASLTVGSLRRRGATTFLTYRRKGGEVETVPIAPEAAFAVEAYLKTRMGLTASSPLWVASSKGKAAAARLGRYEEGEEKPLTTRAIRYLVGTYAKAAFGPGHGIHPHSLRHTAAHVAEAEGLSFTEVSRLLKHKSPTITTIYLQATSDNDEEVAEALGRRYS